MAQRKLVDRIHVEDNIVKSTLRFPVDPDNSVPKTIFKSLKEKFDERILYDVTSDRSYTGHQFLSAVRKCITVWQDVIHVQMGETIAFYCPNSDWYAINMIALSTLSCVVTGGNESYKLGEFLAFYFELISFLLILLNKQASS